MTSEVGQNMLDSIRSICPNLRPRRIAILFLIALLPNPAFAADGRLHIAPFEADITPPLGAPLCDALVPPAKEIVDRLKARGVVLLTDGDPIVLCAMDWVGTGNGGYDVFREGIAQAAKTKRERVSVHC